MARKRRSLLGGKGSKLTAIPAADRVAGRGAKGAVPPKAQPAKPQDPEPPEASEAAASPPPDSDPDEQPTVLDEGGQAPSELSVSPDAVDDGDDLEDNQETEVITTRPRAPGDPVVVEEDDEPMIGADLTVPPPDEDEDAPAAPQEVVAHLHTRPPEQASQDGPPGEPPSDDDLVLFDERPDDEAVDTAQAADAAADSVESFDEADDEPYEPPPELFDPETALHSPTPPPRPDRGTGEAGAPPQESAVQTASDDPDPSQADVPPLEDELPGAGDPGESLAEANFFAEEEGDPPTEERPPGMQAEDFAALYRAPMDVPDAPVMPGILGGETPPPVAGQKRAAYKPVAPPSSAPAPEVTAPRGLWDETPLPNSGRDPSASATPPAPSFRDRPPVPDDVPFYQDTWFIVAAGAAAFAAIAVLLLVIFLGPGMGNQSPEPPRTPTRSGPAAPDLSRPPADLDQADEGTEPGEADQDLPEVRSEPAEPDPGGSTTSGSTTSGSTTSGSTTPATTPETTTSRPAPEGGRTGRLKIRASKQTLIYVNGKPVGMTPLDLDRPSGKYEISGDVDGQRRMERVDLSAGTIRLVEF